MYTIIIKLFKGLSTLVYSRITWAVTSIVAAIGLLCCYGFKQGSISAKELRDSLARTNPAALSLFDTACNRYGEQNMLCSYKYYRGGYGKDAIRTFGIDLTSKASTPQTLGRAYALLQAKDKLLSKEQQRQLDVLSTIATSPDADLSPNVREATSFLLDESVKALENARREGGKTWEVASRDTMGAMAYHVLCMDKQNRTAWETYCQNAEWMSSALFLLYITDSPEIEIADAKNVETNFPEALIDFVMLCQKYPSMVETLKGTIAEWKEAMQENKAEHAASYVPLLMEAYTHYGSQLETLWQRCQIDPKDTLSIILLNRKGFAEGYCSVGDVENLFRHGGKLWDAARVVPEFLSLCHMCAPSDLEKVAGMDVDLAGLCAMVLYAANDDKGNLNAAAVANLVHALAVHGRTALEGINQPTVLPSMKLPEMLALDWRVPAFLKQHPDNGLKLLSEDPKWLDKEFKEDGRPKKDSVLGYVPFVGGIIKVSMNVAQGYPNTWGEIGWAAFDVAEDALAIAAFVATAPGGGAGGLAVKGMGAAAKSAANRGAKSAFVMTGDKLALKQASREIIADVAKKSIPKLGFRSLDKWLIRKSSQAISGLGRSYIVGMGKVLVKSLWKAAVKSDRLGREIFQGIYSKIGMQGTARILAGAMICIDVCRFMPHAGELAAYLVAVSAEVVVKIAKDLAEGTVRGLADAIVGNLGLMPGDWCIYAIAAVLLLATVILLAGWPGSGKKKRGGMRRGGILSKV